MRASPNFSNVLLIQADQWHHALLSCLSSNRVRTPHLDALAGEGAILGGAGCQHPMCLPSRVSLLCGQYPSTTRQWGFTGWCDGRAPSMPRTFKKAGFKVGASGKFHAASLGASTWDEFDFAAPTLPEEEFLARPVGNHYRAWCGQNGAPWPSDQNHGHIPPPIFPPEMAPLPKAWRVSEKAPRDANFYVQSAWESQTDDAHSLETYTVDRFLDFLDAHEQSPWWFWLSFDRPHTPTTLPPAWFERVGERAKNLELPPFPTLQQVQGWPLAMFEALGRRTSIWQHGEADFRWVLASYDLLIEYIDEQIGRALQSLQARGLWERTHVVFTADHGEQAGWGGTYEKALRNTSEAIVRVPLIFRVAPQSAQTHQTPPKGKIWEERVELLDLFPTLCALSGIEAPPNLEGRDLSQTLFNGAPLSRTRAVVCEAWNRKSIARGGWRLVFHREFDAECALFNTASDPCGYENLYGESEFSGVRLELKGALLQWLCERHFGPFDARDARHLARAFHPQDETLPLVAQVSRPAVSRRRLFWRRISGRVGAVFARRPKRRVLPASNRPLPDLEPSRFAR